MEKAWPRGERLVVDVPGSQDVGRPRVRGGGYTERGV